MKKNNLSQYNFIVNERFSNLPVSMLKLLSDTENRVSNLEKILDMINTLRSVKNGEKTYENAENECGMNDEEIDGEINWDAKATSLARQNGTISAY